MRATVFLAVLMGAAASFGQGDPNTISQILINGRDKSKAKEIHTKLCFEVGARVTGSRALERGYIWALDQFTKVGATNVHLEEWGKVPLGFDRGKRQTVRMTLPYEKDFVFTTPCWTVGTNGPVRGKVVREPATVEDVAKEAKNLKGAWILMPKEGTMRAVDLRNPSELDKALDAADIAGRIWRTNGDLVWTHSRWDTYTDANRPKTPMLIVRKRDYETMTYSLDRGREVQMEANVENIITRREFPCYNVIAEIKGSEKPDEVVIVMGHFDSWNGPGSQGAADNGTGTAATIEACRILMASGAKPKRTIRFILWTGEEQGLLGSMAYVKQHEKELDKISCALNEDSGQNPHAAILSLPSMTSLLQQAVAPMANAFTDLPVVVREVAALPRGGSDHGSFLMRGVPAFFLQKNNKMPYSYVWHTQNDRSENVPDLYLRQMSTNLAVLSYNIACADQLLPRVPLSATVPDLHPVGGVLSHEEDPTCHCALPPEIGLRLSRRFFP